jgi:hypothetical protein
VRNSVIASSLDSAAPIPGYYDSPFPGEDGGPRRQLIPRAAGLGIRGGETLPVISRPAVMANMVVLRAPGATLSRVFIGE